MEKLLIFVSNLAIGGAQKMCFELAKKIKKYEVLFLVKGSKCDSSLEKEIEANFTVEYLSIDGKNSIFSFKKAYKTLSRINPSIIHCHLNTIVYASPWCFFHKKKLIVTIHTNPQKSFSKINQKALKFAFKHGFCKIVAVSRENQKLCNEFYNTDKVFCINNGIDVTKYYKKSHSIFTFIHVARQDKNKNAVFIIDCFNELVKKGYNIKMFLLGDGEEHNNIIKKINDLNLNDKIVVTGNVSNTFDYYALSDCFLLASYREALPMTCIEALACKIPIISTNVGGIKDVIMGNGFLIDVDDKDNYILAMECVINNSINNLEEISNRLIEEFTSENMAKKYEDIYKL